ncbi:MAG: helix-turn-helix domain-containing protein [Ferruginibacter sp.]
MEGIGVQQLFFQHIKVNLPPHLSLVDEVAELLDISNDSAYRRIRGEKPISLEEIQKLCSHYKVSMDQFLQLKTDNFIFSGILNSNSQDAFENYMTNLLQNFQFVNSFNRKHLYILMKDIPPFMYFHINELAAFKYFFWMKSILNYDSMKNVKFSTDDPMYEPFYPTGKKIVDLYNKIPVTEIWNIESINSTLRQVNFYVESGAFKSINEAKLLYSKFEELINHLEKQAEFGCKFNIGEKPVKGAASYNLFVNELILGDNTYLAELEDMRISFLNHSVLYFVATRDARFNDAIHNNLQNLMKKSTMISTIGEKERVTFFNLLREKIHERMVLLK